MSDEDDPIARCTPQKGSDPSDKNIYCPFPRDASALHHRCGRRAHSKCIQLLCKKCCAVVSTLNVHHICPQHPDTIDLAKAEPSCECVSHWLELVNRAQVLEQEELQEEHPGSPELAADAAGLSSPSVPALIDALNSMGVGSGGANVSFAAPPVSHTSISLPKPSIPTPPPAPTISLAHHTGHATQHTLPKAIFDANASPGHSLLPKGVALWTLADAQALLSRAIYKMGDTHTVQELKREVEFFIRLREALPVGDPNGVITDQQLKCTEIILQRMGYKHTWAANEKSFFEGYVQVPTHMGKPYAYLKQQVTPPATVKGKAPFLSSFSSGSPSSSSSSAKRPAGKRPPPSACRACGEMHWAADCPLKKRGPSS